MILEDRVRGCLLGGACGDALGAPVEFLSASQILDRYGSDGITDLGSAYGVSGAVTDDTQMTLFTVEGLIRSAVRFNGKGLCHIPTVVHHAYLRWLATQKSPYEEVSFGPRLDGWLVRDRRLWARRAPGATCLSALSRPTGGVADNDSKGCGTVMRDAPFGLAGVHDPELAFTMAAETASMTHGHPSARFASAAIALIIALIARGRRLLDAVACTQDRLGKEEAAGEVRSALRRAVDLSNSSDWRRRLPELGDGWTAEEALAISVLCALAADTSRDAIVASVNHGGDSDSTGSITGQIVGTMRGVGDLPKEWIGVVELVDVIDTLARDLCLTVSDTADWDDLAARYPGW